MPIAKTLVQSVHELRQRTGTRKTGLAIARNRDHAWRIYNMLLCMRDPANPARNIKVGIVVSGIDNSGTFDELESGKLHVLVAVGMVTEGYDWPPFCSVAFFYGPNSSLVVEQIFGRILRTIRYGEERYVIKERDHHRQLVPVAPAQNVIGAADQAQLDAQDQTGYVIFLKIFKLSKKFRKIGKTVQDETAEAQLPPAPTSNDGSGVRSGGGDEPPAQRMRWTVVGAETGNANIEARGDAFHEAPPLDTSAITYNDELAEQSMNERPPWDRNPSGAAAAPPQPGVTREDVNQAVTQAVTQSNQSVLAAIAQLAQLQGGQPQAQAPAPAAPVN